MIYLGMEGEWSRFRILSFNRFLPAEGAPRPGEKAQNAGVRNHPDADGISGNTFSSPEGFKSYVQIRKDERERKGTGRLIIH